MAIGEQRKHASPSAFIGIDPGKSGGIARIDTAGKVIGANRMPDTERDILDLLANDIGGAYAVVERVSSWPGMGVVSAFTFGRGYGALLMALVSNNVPFETIPPAHWQKTMGCLSKRDKNVTKRKAQQLFHGLTVTHAIADALLLAEYGRRTTLGIHWRK